MSLVFEQTTIPTAAYEPPEFMVDPRRGTLPAELPKYQARLNEVRARMRGTQEITLLTPFCARLMRREFNLVSTKMYIFGLDRNFKKTTLALLDDLSWARGDLKESAKLYNGVDTSNLIPSTYTIDLVSPETLLLCRIIQLADYELSKLYAAQLNNQITVYDRYAMMRPFLMAYEVFKRHVLKLKSRTMDEMLSDGEEF